MNTDDIERILLSKGVKPTSNRILVVRELLHASHPISLADLELKLDTLDKSSIFRVLELLEDKEIIHVIEDGSRSAKYEICQSHDQHSIYDQHVHFHCEMCGKTVCLKNIIIPAIEIPPGYITKSINYLLKGVCPSCENNNNNET